MSGPEYSYSLGSVMKFLGRAQKQAANARTNMRHASRLAHDLGPEIEELAERVYQATRQAAHATEVLSHKLSDVYAQIEGGQS